jgi:2-dehydro-3-deoxygalactonokinase
VKHDQRLLGPTFDDMTSPTALIGIDWGTTSFRAYRISADGQVLDSRRAEAGILNVPHGEFEGVFEREVGPWLMLQPDLPVLASGMITSRQGWVEVPYCPCPAGRAEIAGALLRHATTRGRIIHFVPGLSMVDPDGVPDVIRGEETQIIGEIGAASGRRLLLLPGTHSKWALVENGRIVWFATFMTGEVFGVLKEHSILGRLMAGEAHDAQAFRRGVAYARGAHGGLLKRLFSARTLGLFGQLPAEAIASYLSGVLIGTEVGDALDCLDQAPADQEITVIGSSDLSARYLTAIEGAGLRGCRAAADAAAHGLFLIAAAAGHLG